MLAIIGLVFLLTALKWGALLFTVHQYETAIVTRFGKAIRVEKTPGLKFKVPFIDSVHRFDNRILAWDGPPTECPTKDKLYLIVDCFARWKISDPLLYYNRLNDERSALSRLDDILGSETRTAVASNDLVEIVRLTKGRKPLHDAELRKPGPCCHPTFPMSSWAAARSSNKSPNGRGKRSKDSGSSCSMSGSSAANTTPPSPKKSSSGCRASGTRSPRNSVPKAVAKRPTSTDKKRATSLRFNRPRPANSLKIEGEADAEAARIYAAAYNSPEAQGLYSFVRRLEVARYGFSQGTTAVISTESDFGNVLKGIGGAGIVPTPPH